MLINAVTIKTFEEAFKQADSLAKAGDVILLSPACASYDMFLNYEERGRQFKNMSKAFLTHFFIFVYLCWFRLVA